MKHYSFLLFSILLLINTPIQAHDFWLEANPYLIKPNQQTGLSINVGENMKGETLPNIPAWYRAFDVITADGLKPVEGNMGAEPAGHFSHQTHGIYAIGYLSNKDTVQLDAEKFTKYLKNQGLEKIIKQRKTLGEADQTANEIYSRNVKALVKVGDKNIVNFYQYDFKHPLNITPLQDPYQLKQGENLKVKITFRQQPAVDLLVKAEIKDNTTYQYQVRTNTQGIATIPLSHKGIWLIKAVEMERLTNKDEKWESYWGSLTFELAL
ncbi:MAG: DUF4198 domain-containing protein [Gammaproteobacteria bacterium]|nr:DUF4198 domain-containing protein [Gammaproteobacteria bacterium]